MVKTTEKSSLKSNRDHMLLFIESWFEIGPLVLELKPNKGANESNDKLLEIYKHVELIYVLVAVLLNHQTAAKNIIISHLNILLIGLEINMSKSIGLLWHWALNARKCVRCDCTFYLSSLRSLDCVVSFFTNAQFTTKLIIFLIRIQNSIMSS